MQFKSFQLVIAGAALLAASAAAADKPAFAGTWRLDSDQSKGDAPSWASMVVVQKGHWFHMAQNDKDGRLVRSFEGECKTDGRFHPVQGGDGGSIACKWDGSSFTTQQHWNDNHNERSVQTSLDPDGHLIQEIHETAPEGSKDSHLVWKRQ
ncbi:MAG: hypothetical protein ABJC09_14080 [Terriglobia bacterium]